MRRVSKLITLLIAFAALTLSTPAVKADEIVIGGAGDGSNRFPFGLDTTRPNYLPGAPYQQLYNRARFPGPVTITQIAFASSSVQGTPGTATYSVFESRVQV